MFEQPNNEQQRLGQAILAGVELAKMLRGEGIKIEENPYHFMMQRFPADGTWMVCVIGHAMLGLTQNFLEAHRQVREVWWSHHYTWDMCKHFAELLDVSYKLVRDVDYSQINEKKRIEVILPDLMQGKFSCNKAWRY